jgi:hypothetical protein
MIFGGQGLIFDGTWRPPKIVLFSAAIDTELSYECGDLSVQIIMNAIIIF